MPLLWFSGATYLGLFKKKLIKTKSLHLSVSCPFLKISFLFQSHTIVQENTRDNVHCITQNSK